MTEMDNWIPSHDVHPWNEKILIYASQNGTHKARYKVRKYSSLGCYPIFYLTADNGCLCPQCVEDNIAEACNGGGDWRVVVHDVNYEDPYLYCDHCGERIESAYADDPDTEIDCIEEFVI